MAGERSMGVGVFKGRDWRQVDQGRFRPGEAKSGLPRHSRGELFVQRSGEGENAEENVALNMADVI